MNMQQTDAVRDTVVAVISNLTPSELQELVFGPYIAMREELLVPLAA